MLLTPVDDHGNPTGPTTGGHSIEGLRAELARIPAMDTEPARRMVERLGRELRKAEDAARRAADAARSDRDWERVHRYAPTVAMGSLGQVPAPPPRRYPSVVVGVALRGLDA